jgi:hypothetical protein
MTSVHKEPHPLAQRYIKPSNVAIAKKFGIVRIEDWDDRVSGDTWVSLRERGNASAEQYVDSLNNTARDTSVLVPEILFEVVRCHTQSTGELVLLHHDWLKNGQVIA